MKRSDLIEGHRATPEDEELIRWRGKPNEALIRFRHIAADGTLGDYRRVKVTQDVLDDAMRRCAKEFG